MARLDAAFTRSFYPKQIGLGIVIILVGISIAFWFRPDPHLLLTISMDDAVEAVAISPDARYLAAGDRQGRVMVWDRVGGTSHQTASSHQGPAMTLAFSPDGQLLASGGQDGVVHVWDVATGRETSSQAQIAPGRPIQFLSGDGRTQTFRDGVSQVVFSPDGQMLAAGGAAGRILVIAVDSGAVIFDLRGHPLTTSPGRNGPVLRIAFSRDQQWLVSGSWDKTVRLWDLH